MAEKKFKNARKTLKIAIRSGSGPNFFKESLKLQIVESLIQLARKWSEDGQKTDRKRFKKWTGNGHENG